MYQLSNLVTILLAFSATIHCLPQPNVELPELVRKTSTTSSFPSRSISDIAALYNVTISDIAPTKSLALTKRFGAGVDSDNDVNGAQVSVNYGPSSGTCPAISDDWVDLTQDVGANMQRQNTNGFRAGTAYDAEATTAPINGITYEGALQVRVDDDLDGDDSADLVNLLGEVAVDLFDLTNQQGYGLVQLSGSLFGSAFIAFWTYTIRMGNNGRVACG